MIVFLSISLLIPDERPINAREPMHVRVTKQWQPSTLPHLSTYHRHKCSQPDPQGLSDQRNKDAYDVHSNVNPLRERSPSAVAPAPPPESGRNLPRGLVLVREEPLGYLGGYAGKRKTRV
jgi:hypothetical protein